MRMKKKERMVGQRIEEKSLVQFHHMLMDFRDQVTSDACNSNMMLLTQEKRKKDDRLNQGMIW